MTRPDSPPLGIDRPTVVPAEGLPSSAAAADTDAETEAHTGDPMSR